MSLHKQKFNPISGSFNLVPTGTIITFKDGVANVVSLPVIGNILNDARIANDTGHLYVWDGTQWVDQGDIIDLKWSSIDGKPTSSVADIDDAVSKKHSNSLDHAQGTDQGLDTGGVNAVSASQAKAGYTHSGLISGNPHNVSKSDIGLSDVDNKSEATIITDVKADTDVADAISKKHTQDTDTKLDKNGITEVSSFELLKNIYNLIIFNFNYIKESDRTFMTLLNGVVDCYNNEDGIDTIASINETYDVGNFYSPPPPGYTIDLCVGGTAFADSYYAKYTPSLAFDDLDSDWSPVTIWYVTTLRPHWIGYDFGVGNEKKIEKLRFKPMNELGVMVKDFQFQGSNNYSDWTTIYTGIAAASETWQEFLFENSISYRYYRIYITSSYRVDQQFCGIWEIEMMESVDIVEMTLISKSFNFNIQPSNIRLIILKEDIDSIILNTDLLVYVSRNNGVTWTQGILTNEGMFDLTKEILITSINVSSQPIGTQVKYKIFITNNKRCKIHATALLEN